MYDIWYLLPDVIIILIIDNRYRNTKFFIINQLLKLFWIINIYR